MKVGVNAPEIDEAAAAKAMEAALQQVLQAGVQRIVNEAKRSLADGKKTGRIYKRGNIEHQASAPGEAPATDTGVLVGSIYGDVEGLKGYVEARAQYATWLENGTRHIAPRPFMVPAIERARPWINEMIGKVAAKGGGIFKPKKAA